MYYHGSLLERNGEQEYSHDYLIQAKSYEEAENCIESIASRYYGWEADYGYESCPQTGNDGIYSFLGGQITIEVDRLERTTKQQFVNHLLLRRTRIASGGLL
jgi:hypothetical protein